MFTFFEDVMFRNYDFVVVVQDGEISFIDSIQKPELYRSIVDLTNAAPPPIPQPLPEPIPPVGEINFHWPTDFKIVTQSFGANPQIYNQFGLPGHEGIDLKAPTNSPIKSVWAGEVTRVDKTTQHKFYGWHIRLQVEINGDKYEMAYAHLDAPSQLNVGDKVKRAQTLGGADSTGNSTGSHLHLLLKQHKDGELAKEFAANGWPTAKNGYTIIDPTPFFPELR